MRFQSSVATLALAALANCQSPPGFSPATNTSLTVHYGNLTITPNETVAQSAVASVPSLSLNGSHTGTYFVMLADLSIADASAPTTYTLVQGLQPNRTTRLHWLQTNVTVGSNGTLSWPNSTAAIAPYGGPHPPSNDTAHTYAFYLFTQPSGTFHLPGFDGATGRNYTDVSTSQRVDFNISALAAVDGAPVAANYFVVNNGPGSNTTSSANSTSTATGVAGGVTSSATHSGSSSTGASSSHAMTSSTASGASAMTHSTSATSSPSHAAAATHFAAAGLFGLVGAAALL